jgi:uncharacterized protein YbaR (Trm112 family)
MISPEQVEQLRCPMDPSNTRLTLADDRLLCQRCGLGFRIKDGIVNMVVDQAELSPGCDRLSQLPCQRGAAGG